MHCHIGWVVSWSQVATRLLSCHFHAEVTVVLLNPDIFHLENCRLLPSPSDQDMHCFPSTVFIEITQLNWPRLGKRSECAILTFFNRTGANFFVCLFRCFTSQVNSYGHCGTVSSSNHTFSWTGLNKRLTSFLCTYFRL